MSQLLFKVTATSWYFYI